MYVLIVTEELMKIIENEIAASQTAPKVCFHLGQIGRRVEGGRLGRVRRGASHHNARSQEQAQSANVILRRTRAVQKGSYSSCSQLLTECPPQLMPPPMKLPAALSLRGWVPTEIGFALAYEELSGMLRESCLMGGAGILGSLWRLAMSMEVEGGS